MKFIIFGTGNYCLKYLKYIDMDQLLFFVDNDTRKYGEKLKEKPIYPIDNILQAEYSYIIVLVKNFEPIIEQLLKFGIPENKIVPYAGMADLFPIPQKICAVNGEKSVAEWIANRSGKKIFLCIHYFSRSGVPVALMNLAILLKRMNYHVLMYADGEGSLEEELHKKGIDYIVGIDSIYASKHLSCIKEFDIIVLGTLCLENNIGEILSGLEIPIIWWIHESLDAMYQAYRLSENKKKIHFYGVGSRVIRKFGEYYPNEHMEKLLYYLPDNQLELHCHSKIRKFALIGDWCQRKAQDILISAIKELEDDIRKRCFFYFVGVSSDEDRKIIDDLCDEFTEVKYVYEMNQEEIAEFYKQIDVLICPSRDDPMPIVVTQALQNGIPCIVSDQVGQCEFFEKIEGGVVFPSEDIKTLKQIITEFVFYPDSIMESYSKNARTIFDLFFSEKRMQENIEKILNSLL